MLDWYFENYDKTIWLGTSPNTRAENFYRANGWKEVGRRKNGEIKFEMGKKNRLVNGINEIGKNCSYKKNSVILFQVGMRTILSFKTKLTDKNRTMCDCHVRFVGRRGNIR